MKNRIFKHEKLPLSVENFLKIHCTAISGSMKILKANMKHEDTENNDNNNIVDRLLQNETSLKETHATENWRGLAAETNNYVHKKFKVGLVQSQKFEENSSIEDHEEPIPLEECLSTEKPKNLEEKSLSTEKHKKPNYLDKDPTNITSLMNNAEV